MFGLFLYFKGKEPPNIKNLRGQGSLLGGGSRRGISGQTSLCLCLFSGPEHCLTVPNETSSSSERFFEASAEVSAGALKGSTRFSEAFPSTDPMVLTLGTCNITTQLPSQRQNDYINNRSLRNENKISRQSNLHFQNVIVVALPTKNSIFGKIFLSAPQGPPLSKSRNCLFIVVSPSLK